MTYVMKMRADLVSKYSSFFNNKMYFEFGVADGTSLLQFYEYYRANNIKGEFYGFDSFLGLPEEKLDENNPSYWQSGEYTCKGTINPNLIKSDIKIIDGWFDETLTKEFAESLGDKKIGLLHIDCDIYTSAYKSLDFCFENNLIIPGTIIMYDDWGCYYDKLGDGHEFEAGEGKAHKEIMEKYNIDCTYLDKHIIAPRYYEISVFKIN